MHTDGRNLRGIVPFTSPDAGQARDAPGANSKPFQRINEDLLDGADESAYIALPVPQIHDGVGYHLARAMIGHVATTICLVQFDAVLLQKSGCCEDVIFVPVAADRDYVGVLHEEEMVGAEALLAFRFDFMLNGKGLVIPESPQIADDALPHSLRYRLGVAA
jgi:hypothetical protein